MESFVPFGCHVTSRNSRRDEEAPDLGDGPIRFVAKLVPTDPRHSIAGSGEHPVPVRVSDLRDWVVVISAAIGFDHNPLITPEEVNLKNLSPDPQLFIGLRDRQVVVGQQRQHLRLHPASQPNRRRVPAPGLEGPVQLLLSAATTLVEDAVDLRYVQDFENGRLLDRVSQQLRASYPGHIDDRARGSRAGNSDLGRDLLGMRHRNEASADPSDFPPCFHRGDDFDVSGPEIPQIEKCRGGAVRDNAAFTASEQSRN